MRLLVVPEEESPGEPLKLIEAFGKNIPRYAILSHTWGQDEVLYSHVQMGTAPDRLAYDKVRGAIAQARKDGHHYLWVDSCCIDKSSSAELQEAINSMYAWYARAEVCYVYLADVHGKPAVSERAASQRWRAHYIGRIECWDPAFESHFTDSRWFKRGWTLQELIAPSRVSFYSSQWVGLGTLSTGSWRTLNLADLIAARTGIDAGLLSKRRLPDTFDIGTRMSWATNRETSREEDIAYCLLGIFDVSMPLLYGEGIKAFARLQEEIMRKSSDHTLFMWTSPLQAFDNVVVSEWASDYAPPPDWACHREKGFDSSGMLAPSPNVLRTQHLAGKHNEAGQDVVIKASPYQMTNEGLEMRLPLTRLNDYVYLAELKTGYGVYLHRLTLQGNVYVRIMCDRLPRLAAYDPINEFMELIYVTEMLLSPFKNEYAEPVSSELSLLPSSDTEAHFMILRAAREEPDGSIRSSNVNDWYGMPRFRLGGLRPYVHWLILQDPERDLFAVIITNLPGWDFPMLGAVPLRFSHHDLYKSTVQLEPAGVDIVMGKYTISTAHASSRNGRARIQDLRLMITYTHQTIDCEGSPPSACFDGPDILSGTELVLHQDYYLRRIDTLTFFTSTEVMPLLFAEQFHLMTCSV